MGKRNPKSGMEIFFISLVLFSLCIGIVPNFFKSPIVGALVGFCLFLSIVIGWAGLEYLVKAMKEKAKEEQKPKDEKPKDDTSC